MKGQMELTHFQERQMLIQWATDISIIAQTRSDTFATSTIQQEIEELMSGRFMLAVLGKVKRGKSTFCNAYLGRQNSLVAPVDKLPSSSVISKFVWSEQEEVTVSFRDGHTELTDYNHIEDFVTEDQNRENVKEVASVEVRGPFTGLEKDLILVDTPGAGSIHKHHDALLYQFLPEADAAIFLVTARMPIADDELELLRALKANELKKIFFAINQKDLVDDGKMTEDELQDAVQHNIAMLAKADINIDKIYRISAKRGMLGKLSDSGIPELLRDISEYLAKNKIQILHSQFRSKIFQTAEALACNMAVEIDSAKKSKTELEKDLAQLRETRLRIEQERERIEANFTLSWNSALEQFEHEIREAEEVSKKQIQKAIIEGFTVVGATQFVKDAPTLIARIINKEVSQAATVFEEDARKAVQKLQLDYPNLSIAGSGDVIVRLGGESNTLIKGAAGVAITTAAGYGLLSAAAAATAATTLTIATPLATLGTSIGGLIGGFLSVMGTGTASIATAPAWVALAGPIGWTLIGIGALVVPFAYRVSRLKMKKQLEEAALDHTEKTFAFIKKERVTHLKKAGARILDQYKLKLQNDVAQIEAATRSGLERKETGKQVQDVERLATELKLLVNRNPASLMSYVQTPSAFVRK